MNISPYLDIHLICELGLPLTQSLSLSLEFVHTLTGIHRKKQARNCMNAYGKSICMLLIVMNKHYVYSYL